MTNSGLKIRILFFRFLPAFFISLVLVTPSPTKENITDTGRSAAVGVNYPGANLKIFLSDSFAFELRGQYQDKILTGGPRLYYFPSISGFEDARLRPFLGLEGDYISFKGRVSKGGGAAFGGVGGVEYFLSRRMSVQADAGPFYILLKDSSSLITQNGLEFVLNLGFNFYFK